MMAFSEDAKKIDRNDGGYFRVAPCMNERAKERHGNLRLRHASSFLQPLCQ